jgi:periplasmic divalent cation tolerance protein
MNKEYAVVFITSPSNDIAKDISQTLLEKKKAACVSIVSDIRSSFWWQGKIERADEWLLVVKTKTSLVDDIIKLVKEIHPDQVPEIIALPITGGNTEYLKWMDEALDITGF